ncbi:helix-turn-helix domain-containing protein [Streptomyces sp. YS-3]|uniref:helix-turn-helix domain-containing protein n=1 Tax=Streptomyces sp. YS-3 TaxID=3381352 RepID=UPI0038623CC2
MARSPARYLAQWRMDLAAIRLRDTAETVEDISAQVGYRSVPSFTRAFARDRGSSPGAYRAQVRASRALEPRAAGRRL